MLIVPPRNTAVIRRELQSVAGRGRGERMEQSGSDQELQLEDLEDLVPFILLNLEAEADTNAWEFNQMELFVSFRISI